MNIFINYFNVDKIQKTFTLDECLIKNCSETGVRILKVLSQIQTDENDQKFPF